MHETAEPIVTSPEAPPTTAKRRAPEATTLIVKRLRNLARSFGRNSRLRQHTSDLHKAAGRIELLARQNKRLRRQVRKLDPENRVLKELEDELS